MDGDEKGRVIMTLQEINEVLAEAIGELTEKKGSYKVGDDQYKLKGSGKIGKWRTIAKHDVFIPADGSMPIGLPKGMSDKKKQSYRAKRGEMLPQYKKKEGIFTVLRKKFQKAAKKLRGK